MNLQNLFFINSHTDFFAAGIIQFYMSCIYVLKTVIIRPSSAHFATIIKFTNLQTTTMVVCLHNYHSFPILWPTSPEIADASFGCGNRHILGCIKNYSANKT